MRLINSEALIPKVFARFSRRFFNSGDTLRVMRMGYFLSWYATLLFLTHTLRSVMWLVLTAVKVFNTEVGF